MLRIYSQRLNLVPLFVLLACGMDDNSTSKSTRINNVVRVFMHTTTYYTLFTQEPGSEIVGQTSLQTCDRSHDDDHPPVQIVTDVAEEELMWAEVATVYAQADLDYLGLCTLHLHSFDEVHGAGWNNGKHGSGETSVVE